MANKKVSAFAEPQRKPKNVANDVIFYGETMGISLQEKEASQLQSEKPRRPAIVGGKIAYVTEDGTLIETATQEDIQNVLDQINTNPSENGYVGILNGGDTLPTLIPGTEELLPVNSFFYIATPGVLTDSLTGQTFEVTTSDVMIFTNDGWLQRATNFDFGNIATKADLEVLQSNFQQAIAEGDNLVRLELTGLADSVNNSINTLREQQTTNTEGIAQIQTDQETIEEDLDALQLSDENQDAQIKALQEEAKPYTEVFTINSNPARIVIPENVKVSSVQVLENVDLYLCGVDAQNQEVKDYANAVEVYVEAVADFVIDNLRVRLSGTVSTLTEQV